MIVADTYLGEKVEPGDREPVAAGEIPDAHRMRPGDNQYVSSLQRSRAPPNAAHPPQRQRQRQQMRHDSEGISRRLLSLPMRPIFGCPWKTAVRSQVVQLTAIGDWCIVPPVACSPRAGMYALSLRPPTRYHTLSLAPVTCINVFARHFFPGVRIIAICHDSYLFATPLSVATVTKLSVAVVACSDSLLVGQLSAPSRQPPIRDTPI